MISSEADTDLLHPTVGTLFYHLVSGSLDVVLLLKGLGSLTLSVVYIKRHTLATAI